MKRLILLLLLLASHVSAQVNIFVPNGGKLVSEEEMKTYVNSWLLRVITPNPGTDPPVDPDTTLQNCLASPAITGVSNISKTSIKVNSTGAGITSINWYVYDITAPGLYLKSGNTQYSTTLTLAWVGDLQPGHYGVKLEAVNCKGSSALDFIIPNTPTPTPCLSGPVIESLFSYSRTGLTFVWSGLNVPEIVWNIRQGGSTVRSGSFVPGSSQTVSITYPQLAFGTYDLQLIGLTCPTSSPAQSFTLIDNTTPPATTARHIYMNMTGFGFDPTQANGIHPDWPPRIEAFLNMNYNGVSFKGIDGVRLNMKWYDYQPNDNTYNDAKLLAVLNYCVARGIRLSVAIIPWRREGDGMFPESHKARLSDGRIWYEEGDLPSTYKTYQPSMHSQMARDKFKAAVRHLAQTLKSANPNYVDYISTATSQTEEYQLIRQESPLMMSGYADIDKSEWNSYSGGLSVPYPANYDINTLNAMMDSPTGKKWYEFHTDGLRQFHAAFVQGVREGGMRVCGMYAGIGAPSGVWDFTYKLNTIYSAGTPDQPDIIYSSEGDAGSQNSKLMATDLNMGTFPGAEPAIEFDPEDVAANQIHNPPYGIDLNGNILYNYSVSFFRRGGKIVHFAMSFHPDKINQLAEACYKIKTEFIDSNTGMSGQMDQGNMITFPIVRYSGLQEYRGMWDGGLTKQTKIKLLSNGDSSPPSGAAVTSYLDNNQGAYGGNILVDVKKAGQGSIYSYTRGQYSRDVMLSVMSLSKSVLAATVLSLVDAGLINIDERVGAYVPSWNSGQKANITVRMIIGHTSGIKDETTYDGYPTLAQAVDGMANTPLEFTPGTQFKYSTTSYQVLARICEIRTGQSFQQVFNSRIRDKCGMGGATFNPGSPYQPITGNVLNPNAGYGLWCTQTDYSNFMSMIRDGGIYGGNRVLSQNSINLLGTDMTQGLGPWGFGMIRNDNGNELTSESAKGCYAWINKTKGYSVVLFTQSTYESTIGINNGLRDLIRNNF